MKIALFATNQFLLITAINMKLSLLKYDEVHLYTTLHTKLLNKTSKYGEKNIFEKIFFIKDLGIIEETDDSLENEMMAAYFADDNFLNIGNGLLDTFGVEPQKYLYDQIIAMGFTYFPYWLCAITRKNGKNAELIRLCDGVVHKHTELNYHFGEAFKNLLHKESFLKKGFSKEFVYKPFFGSDRKKIGIPEISEETIQFLDYISDFKNRKSKVDKYIYIYFTSSTVNGVNWIKNEVEIIEAIADGVGKENLIIKMHPWRKKDDLVNLNIAIDDFSGCSEYLYPHIHVESKVFFSMCTNAAFTPYEMFSRNPHKVFFLNNIMEIDPMFALKVNNTDRKYVKIYNKMISFYQEKFGEYKYNLVKSKKDLNLI